MKHTILFLIVLVLLVPQTAASAHRPIWGEQHGSIKIPNLRTSFVFYRDLSTDQVDVFTLEAEAGQDLHAGIQIPAVNGFEKYEVRVSLFGPGLPAADHDVLPPDHPEDLGVLVFLSQESAGYFEPFTLTYYWGRQDIDVNLPEGGTYYLLVWQPEGKPGKYVLDTGRAEVFEPGDFFRFPVWWVRVHLFFGHGPALALLGAMVLLAITLLVVRKPHKRTFPND